MIEYIEGTLISKTPAAAVIDCGGVGYYLHISLYTYSRMPASGRSKLLAHLSVKEDAHTLFGFSEDEERTLFRQLISVSGIGPSTARMMLSSLSPLEIQQAIVSGDVSVLQSVKGIGGKTAQRIIVDLKDKLSKKEDGVFPFIGGADNTVKKEALSALLILGFQKNNVEKALGQILKSTPGITVEDLIKAALKIL